MSQGQSSEVHLPVVNLNSYIESLQEKRIGSSLKTGLWHSNISTACLARQ